MGGGGEGSLKQQAGGGLRACQRDTRSLGASSLRACSSLAGPGGRPRLAGRAAPSPVPYVTRPWYVPKQVPAQRPRHAAIGMELLAWPLSPRPPLSGGLAVKLQPAGRPDYAARHPPIYHLLAFAADRIPPTRLTDSRRRQSFSILCPPSPVALVKTFFRYYDASG